MKDSKKTLLADTDEKRSHIENICGEASDVMYALDDGVRVDSYLSYDQMAMIVDYLRSMELKDKKDALFEECWIAYQRKGSKKKSKDYWVKLSSKEKEQVLPHIKAYVGNRELQYQKDFERYLRDKTFLTIVVSDKGCVYDPSIHNGNEYKPIGHGIYYDEQHKCYGYTSIYFDGDVVYDGYDDNNRPNNAELVLNNGRGIIKWNCGTKKWIKL